jgi:hypothetical protein
MAITTLDGVLDALGNNSSRFVFDKASLSNAAAGQFFSLWTATGVPSAGAAPGTTPTVPTNATTGAVGFDNQTPPAASYLAWLWAAFGNTTSSVEIHDRLAAVSGGNGTLTTAQTTGCAIDLTTTDPGAARRGSSDYSDVSWWIEIYSALGATGVNATVNVTYSDTSTGNLAAIALGATPRQGRLYQLISASAGLFIRGVNSVTLSATTGTAGNFGITATRQRTVIQSAVANWPTISDWAALGMPEIHNDSCLFQVMLCSTTSTGTVRGQGKIAHG